MIIIIIFKKNNNINNNSQNDVGYEQHDGLKIALQTCHQDFLEALFNHGRSVVGDGCLLTVSSLHELYVDNVGILYLFTGLPCKLQFVTRINARFTKLLKLGLHTNSVANTKS